MMNSDSTASRFEVIRSEVPMASAFSFFLSHLLSLLTHTLSHSCLLWIGNAAGAGSSALLRDRAHNRTVENRAAATATAVAAPLPSPSILLLVSLLSIVC